MVGSLALVAVRQPQHDPGALAPLLLARADELVDDRLGAVDEIAELGFPEDQRVRPGDRVAVLESDRRVLRQQRVIHVELRCRNVPRRESWPTSRTPCPSSRVDPNASSSPVAQSISSCSIITARRCSCGTSLGCGVKLAGRVSWVLMMRLMVSSVMAVGVWSCPAGRAAPGSGRTTAPGSDGRPAASWVSVNARSSSCW